MAKRKRGNWEDRGMMEKMGDRLTMTWRLLMDGRVGLGHKLIPLIAVLYVLSPIDFIPDVFLPLGFGDDVVIFIAALEYFIRMAPSGVVQEHLRDLQGRMQSASKVEQDDVIDVEYEMKS